jgi:branched-chain amino acid transport system permease protein
MAGFVIAGLIAGAVSALVAVGIVFMYQTTGMVNFAFGSMGAVAAFGFNSLTKELVPIAAVIVTVIGGAVVGIGVGAITLPVQRASVAVKAVASLALIQAVIGVIPLVWGTSATPAPLLIQGRAFRIARVNVSQQQVLTFVVAVTISLSVVALFRFGRVGSALRAMAANTNVARLVGLPVRRLWIMSWALGTAVAALAGVLIVPSFGLSAANLSFSVLLPLAAALVASFRHPLRAMVVAFGLGVGDSMMRSQVAPLKVELLGAPLASFAAALPFAFVVIALSLRRSGSWERV